MLQTVKGIVLATVRYNDKSNIAHLYTEQEGMMSFQIPAARSRKAKVINVLFQPFSFVECEADIRPRSNIHLVKEARFWHILQSLPYDPYKSGIVLFLTEFLDRILREEGANKPLFAYLSHSVRWLDACTAGFANFHLVFLIRLSRFLGFYPNLEHYTEGAYFDMLNACFVSARPFHGMFLYPQEASHISKLVRMNYETMHLFAMNRAERNRCLEIICEYYRLHLPDFPELKSLGVLQELFGSL